MALTVIVDHSLHQPPTDLVAAFSALFLNDKCPEEGRVVPRGLAAECNKTLKVLQRVDTPLMRQLLRKAFLPLRAQLRFDVLACGSLSLGAVGGCRVSWHRGCDRSLSEARRDAGR